MENMKCVLITKDENYGRRFCRCVREYSSVLNFSLSDNLEDAAGKNLVLWDCETLGDVRLSEVDISTEMLLFEINSEPRIDKEISLCKYDSLPKIISKMVSVCNRRFNDFIIVPTKNNNCRIITVSAVHGGAGCSSVALAIARDYAFAGHRKTMYISLQSRSEELNFVEKGDEKNIREMLYRVLCDNEKELCIDEYVVKDYFGVDMFRPGGITNEIDRLSMNQWHKFIEFINEKGVYDEVVIDLGTNVSNKAESARAFADYNVLVYDKKRKYLLERTVSELYEKEGNLIVIENFSYIPKTELDLFFEDEEEDESANSMESTVAENELIKIERDDEAFFYNDGMCDMTLDTGFGKKIRKLIKNFY